MDASLVIVPIVALGASLLTFVSGFGLGTLLLPVFAVFFPLEVAIMLTAIVHLLNNLFKFGLLWKEVNWPVVFRFGVPGAAGAFLGAWLMRSLGARNVLFQGILQPVDPLDLTIAVLMLVFGIIELSKKISHRSFPREWLVPGGLLSGFFGGLSGHQGALRSMFLLRLGLEKQAFIATGITIACLVDLMRLPIYSGSDQLSLVGDQWHLLLISTLSAFAGAWLGKQWIPKVTLRTAQILVGILLIAIAVMLGTGVI
jgi:uncharacterized protein